MSVLDKILGLKKEEIIESYNPNEEELNTIEKIKQFIIRLSEFSNNFEFYNMYADKIQSHNYQLYLIKQSLNHANILLLGEGAGYKGARWSGIPFTSGHIIATNPFFFSAKDPKLLGKKFAYKEIMSKKENSAKAVYEFFNYDYKEAYQKIVMFNSIPFHPYKKGFPEKNRTPRKKEIIEIGKTYLKELFGIFRFEYVLMIGKKAKSLIELLIEEKTIDIPKENLFEIRHCSFGGKNLFSEQMKQAITQIFSNTKKEA